MQSRLKERARGLPVNGQTTDGWVNEKRKEKRIGQYRKVRDLTRIVVVVFFFGCLLLVLSRRRTNELKVDRTISNDTDQTRRLL